MMVMAMVMVRLGPVAAPAGVAVKVFAVQLLNGDANAGECGPGKQAGTSKMPTGAPNSTSAHLVPFGEAFVELEGVVLHPRVAHPETGQPLVVLDQRGVLTPVGLGGPVRDFERLVMSMVASSAHCLLDTVFCLCQNSCFTVSDEKVQKPLVQIQ